MGGGRSKHGEDLRGASELAFGATLAITELVEELHRTIASGPGVLGRPLALPASLWTGLVYGHVRRVTRLVGMGIDAGLSQLAPLLGESAPGPQREAVLAALNGVIGDLLSERGNPLAIELSLRTPRPGAPLERSELPLEPEALRAALPDARAKLLVLVHGSSLNDRSWLRQGHDHGMELAREHGYTAVYVHYNTGLHVSSNGRLLASKLDALLRAWPVPVEEIALLGHSMGGLVARSACHAAELEQLAWRGKLKRLACLGSPHHGAALERGGSWIHALLGVSAYSAPFARLARVRSAGVTDLRYGNVLDAHWAGHDRFELAGDRRKPLPLPDGVACYAVAGTSATVAVPSLPGDGLVSVDSALGRHTRTELALDFPTAHTAIALGTGHLDLLDSAQVYDALRTWFS